MTERAWRVIGIDRDGEIIYIVETTPKLAHQIFRGIPRAWSMMKKAKPEQYSAFWYGIAHQIALEDHNGKLVEMTEREK